MTERTILAERDRPALNEQNRGVRPVSTRDGWLMVNPVRGTQLKRALEAFGRPESIAELKALDSSAATHWFFLIAEQAVRRRRRLSGWRSWPNTTSRRRQSLTLMPILPTHRSSTTERTPRRPTPGWGLFGSRGSPPASIPEMPASSRRWTLASLLVAARVQGDRS